MLRLKRNIWQLNKSEICLSPPLVIYHFTRSLKQIILNLELADVALQGFTLTLQFFELWIEDAFLAFHHGRSPRAKKLSFQA